MTLGIKISNAEFATLKWAECKSVLYLMCTKFEEEIATICLLNIPLLSNFLVTFYNSRQQLMKNLVFIAQFTMTPIRQHIST